jgi:hypothetical protein
MLITLDLALTSGIALYDGNIVKVGTVRGTPIEQLKFVKNISTPDFVFVIEKHVHFRNAKTTRNLQSRIGYIQWSLIEWGANVVELFPYKARKHFSADYPFGFSKDERDAVLLVHEYLDIWQTLEIERGL